MSQLPKQLDIIKIIFFPSSLQYMQRIGHQLMPRNHCQRFAKSINCNWNIIQPFSYKKKKNSEYAQLLQYGTGAAVLKLESCCSANPQG